MAAAATTATSSRSPTATSGPSEDRLIGPILPDGPSLPSFLLRSGIVGSAPALPWDDFGVALGPGTPVGNAAAICTGLFAPVGSNGTQSKPGKYTSTQAWALLLRRISFPPSRSPGRNPSTIRVGTLRSRRITAIVGA